jgi:hypothetical protein
MPREENRITLHADLKDEHGMAVADVHFDDHANDTAMRDHAYKQGSALYAAVGPGPSRRHPIRGPTISAPAG